MATSDNLSWRVVLTIEASALVCGTVYSLTRKFMNLTKAEGFAGNTTYFRHPLFQGLWCFLGQLLAWPIWWRMEQRERRRRQAAGGTRDVPLGEQPTSRRAAVLCMLPTLFDVVGTVLNNIGLILTSVSVYQMLRGSVVLFTSLASRLLLKTRFTTKQLQGLVMIAIGVCFIGMVRTWYRVRIRTRAGRSVHHWHGAHRLPKQANTAFSDKPYDPHYAPWPALGNVLILVSQALRWACIVPRWLLMFTPVPTLAGADGRALRVRGDRDEGGEGASPRMARLPPLNPTRTRP